MLNEGKKYNENVWNKLAENIDWISTYSKTNDSSFHKPIKINWFEGGELNVSYNCVDRHLKNNADKIAIIWESEDGLSTKKITYADLHKKVCRFSNVLKSQSISKGDTVCIYMPMTIEAIVAMLACARIGAIHNVIFAGFSANSIADRIKDSKSKLIICGDYSIRNQKKIPLKNNIREALSILNKKIKTIVFNPLGKIADLYDHELNWHNELNKASEKSEPTVLSSNDPLFILYTSGSTGTPKGLVHSSGGYLVHVHNTFKDLFNFKQDDIYWSTADIGWITGHSYGVYGPLSNGATILIFEGNPLYEDGININLLIKKHQVNIFYTAPTLIRSLMSKKHLKNHVSTNSSLKVLGSVGEPLNPEAWSWYYNDFGQQKCPIIDTWWQTETGGILIAPKIQNYKKIAGSAGTSINGTEGFIVDNHAKECKPEEEGFLVFRDSWPGQAISIFGDHARFEKTYFEQFPGFYCSGDGAKKDLQNNFFITGRIDDVLNVSGHRMGTSEIESAIVSHKSVVEAGVIGIPDEVKGETIFAFVAVDDHTKKTTDLKVDIKNWVKKEIGSLAIPYDIELVSELPKTRSGKIMRRILKKIANNDFDNFGDISTLANPESVNELISLKNNK